MVMRYKSATVTILQRNLYSGTGKPHKRETQIMVGELFFKKRIEKWMNIIFIDKCLSPFIGTEYGLLDILFFYYEVTMREIGIKLKEKRESNGVSVEEAAEDLKLRPSQIEKLEEGDIKEFNDIFYLKYFIRDYAKYLGLDSEKLVDEFNEFLFDYTSKIPIQEIEKAKQEKKKPVKKIVSPYTITKKRKFEIPPYVIYILIGLLIIIIGYLLLNHFGKDDFEEEVITYYEKR